MKDKIHKSKNRAWTTSVFMKIYGCHRFILSKVLRCHACLWQLEEFAGKAAYDGYAEHLRSLVNLFAT